ncbi:MAG TPA: hypothetical protein VN739_09675 [Nitrososphaerales archaeon]|nr:hypothetical protein [Nitrososphaerales archaeon]
MLATALVVWSPYEGSGALLLSLVLAIIGLALILLGRRVTKEFKLPRLGKILGVIVVIIWIFSILIFLRINRDFARYTGSAGNLGPIFPITIITAVCTFALVAYVSRRDGIRAALGRGFLAFIAGPMVFEFPFLLIVIPRVSAPLVPALIFLIPLFTIIFTTLSMLLFSRKVAITRYSIYFFGAMILVFAVWALDGYSYPSNSTSFLLNAISKVLGFAAVSTLFVKSSQKIDSPIPKPQESSPVREQ